MTGAALVLCVLLGGTDVAMATTLEEAVRAALRTNPEVGVVLENRRAVSQELRQARGRLFPEISVRAARGLERTNNSTTRNRQKDGNDGAAVDLPRTDASLTIRQLLFDGFDSQAQIERQRARLNSAAQRVRETSEFVALDAVEVYLEALRQRELIAIAKENIRVHENHVALVRAKVEGGAASRADLEQAQARLATARDTLVQADGLRRDADARYQRIIGEDPIDLSRPVIPVNALPKSVDEAVALAVRFNPTIRVARSDIAIAEAELAATKSSLWPTFNIELTANTSNNGGGVRGPDTRLSALLVMNYNLYRGGADIARTREFVARLGEARQRLNQAIRQAEETTRLSWNALANARDRLVQLRAIVQANEQVREVYKKQFDIGRRTLLDLLDSENQLFLSRSNLVTSEFVEMFGVYRILASTGLLLETLDIEPAREAFTNSRRAAAIEARLRQYIDKTRVHDAALGIGERGRIVAPSVPEGPVLDPNAPVLDPNAPVSGPDGGVLDPNAPVLDPNAPVSGPDGGVLDPNAPVLDPNAPVSGPGGGVLDPNVPVLDPNAPVSGPDGGVLDPNAPVGGPRSLLPRDEFFTEPRSADIGRPDAAVGPPRSLLPERLPDFLPAPSPAVLPAGPEPGGMPALPRVRPGDDRVDAATDRPGGELLAALPSRPSGGGIDRSGRPERTRPGVSLSDVRRQDLWLFPPPSGDGSAVFGGEGGGRGTQRRDAFWGFD